MSISSRFQDLVRDLDQDSLEDLGQFVTTEIEQRRGETGFQVESIHPQMTLAEREQAANEIARALRELA